MERQYLLNSASKYTRCKVQELLESLDSNKCVDWSCGETYLQQGDMHIKAFSMAQFCKESLIKNICNYECQHLGYMLAEVVPIKINNAVFVEIFFQL